MDGQKCVFLHSEFHAMDFGYTATTKLLAYTKLGFVLTKNNNSMEVSVASARGWETKSSDLH